MQKQDFRLQLGDTELIFEVGQYAQQCNASCVVSYGDTSVLATCTISRQADDIDYLPLMVNYTEKFYAAGMIGGNRYQRREGRPLEQQILTGRVIDRGLRPMVNKYVRNTVQVIPTVISYDLINSPDVVAANGASFATAISECPMHSPLGTVRVGLIEGEFVLNPSMEARKKSELDLIVTSSIESVVMIEAGANQVPEEKMYEAIMFGKKWGQKIATFIKEVQAKIGKEKMVVEEPEIDADLKKKLTSEYESKIEEIMFADITKLERFAKIADITKEAEEKVLAETENEELQKQVHPIIDKIVKHAVRHHIVSSGKRIRNRTPEQIRNLTCEVDLFSRMHGSALFQRGETQGVTITTLGGPGDKMSTESLDGDGEKFFFHHYNFPPYSVGETSFRLGTGNREIGHGNLAEKALVPVIPSNDEFPYIIRAVTEILQSNGSSSMAAVCGTTLSLMAAGVPLKSPVSGVAMGMMTEEETGKYVILTDLQDEEDFGGDMDFKVAGTKDGITAIQVDIKLKGLSDDVIKETLDHAKDGRLRILEKMLEAIPEPRAELSEFAPRLIQIKIDPEQIRAVIGKGGEVINGIIEKTGVEIDISDDGNIVITTKDAAMGERAKEIIEKITEKPEVGKIYDAKVVKIMDFGAFCEILPGVEGLVHISMLKKERVNNVTDVVNEGDQVKVKLLEIDSQGRLRLSMKDAEQQKEPATA